MKKVFKEISRRCNEDDHTEFINDYILKLDPKLKREAENYMGNTWKHLGETGMSNTKQLLKFIAYIELLRIENNRWLLDYLEGIYERKDLNFHNMPLDVEEYLNKFARYYGDDCFQSKCFKNQKNLKLYRGISFDSYKEIREWYDDEVIRIDDDSVILNTNKYTSWSTSEDVSLEFTENKYGILYSYIFSPEEYSKFWNLSLLNEDECEFILIPGLLQCKIESILKDAEEVDSFDAWDK
jgi:hypothetical protein